MSAKLQVTQFYYDNLSAAAQRNTCVVITKLIRTAYHTPRIAQGQAKFRRDCRLHRQGSRTHFYVIADWEMICYIQRTEKSKSQSLIRRDVWSDMINAFIRTLTVNIKTPCAHS